MSGFDLMEVNGLDDEAASRLQHPNIVRTLDVGQSNGMYYLVMEYVEGVDAQRLLDREKRFAPMRAINIAGFVALALSIAHGEGVIHRDIKPANILLGKDGKVKVTDFGLARGIANTATALTLSNQVVGTPNYMAPEQIKSMDVDHRVDIYALGVTLWQFLTGRLPFEAATPMAVLLNVVQENLELPPEVFGKLPREVGDAVIAMTHKDPARRLADIGAAIAALKSARDALRKAGMDNAAPPEASGKQEPVPQPKLTGVRAKPKGVNNPAALAQALRARGQQGGKRGR